MGETAMTKRRSLLAELLDGVIAAADYWESEVERSEFVSEDAELKASAERIGEAIGDFYQLAGERMPASVVGEDGEPSPLTIEESRRARITAGPAHDAVNVSFGLPYAGWIDMEVEGLTFDRAVQCSCVYDPFKEMLEWLEKICAGASCAVWDIDSEWYTTILIYHADVGITGGEGARLILCGAGEEVYRLSALAVEPRPLVEGFYRAFREMANHPDYNASEWEMPTLMPAIDPELEYDLPDGEDRRRLEACHNANPYDGWILRCLESEQIERALGDPDCLKPVGVFG